MEPWPTATRLLSPEPVAHAAVTSPSPQMKTPSAKENQR
jgi:hypothetical protein